MTITRLTDTKALLAKLLAGENITVLHENLPTAFFDLAKRVLHCPNWDDISSELHDLLKAHEVGHGLYTPAEGWHNEIFKCRENHEHKRSCLNGNFKHFLNVCEDARIERKVKTKFPGLKRSFAVGYRELFDRNFFGVRDIDVNKLNLIDRLNLWFKVGAHLQITFSDTERAIVNRLEQADTWEQVVQIAHEVYEICRHQTQKIQTIQDLQQEMGGDREFDPDNSDEEGQQSAGSEESDEEGEDEQGQPGSVESDDDSDEEGDAGSCDGDSDESDETDAGDDGTEDKDESAGTGGDSPEKGEDESEDAKSTKGAGNNDDDTIEDPTSVTDQIFHDREKNLAADTVVVNATLPQVNLDKIIYPVDYVVGFFERSMNRSSSIFDYAQVSNDLLAHFLNKHKAHINLLVKEFEMRKNAKQYTRSQVHKTGELDTQRIAQYKFNSDIFRRITEAPKGKSHGMMMYLDMSGSMDGSFMFHSVEQIIILTAFCSRVGIPFDVYGFADTNEYGDLSTITKRTTHARITSKETDLVIRARSGFHLRQLITSDSKPSVQKRAVRMLATFAAEHYHNTVGFDIVGYNNYSQQKADPKLYELASKVNAHLGGGVYGVIGHGLTTRGTPLAETIVCSRAMIQNFKSSKKLDIVNVIYLTDGDGGSIGLPGFTHLGPIKKVIVTDPVTRLQVISDDPYQLQGKLLELVKYVTGCRHIGYYITQECSLQDKIGADKALNDDPVKKQHHLDVLKQHGYYAAPEAGFDTYYFITTKFMGYEERNFRNIKVTNKTTVDQLYNEFTANQLNKKAARVVLGKFAQELANEVEREDL